MNAELAWAAGFFEGEGCVSVDRRGASPRLKLDCSQKYNRKILERFHAAVGVGKIHNKKAAVFSWCVQGAGAFEAMQALLPYLGEFSTKAFRYQEALDEGCRPEKSNGWATGKRTRR